jgi:ATP-dependent DNA helicase PIF1
MAEMIVWDEVPMTRHFIFETVDRTLKDLMKAVDPVYEFIPFGEKIVLFGGDFRQIPPVVTRGSREDSIAACLKRSQLWQHIHSLHLSVNMRLSLNSSAFDFEAQAEFARSLLQVGEGTLPRESTNQGISTIIELPPQIVMPTGSKLTDLISTVYSNLGNHIGDADYLRQRSVLCAVSDDADEVNTQIMDVIGGKPRDLLSVDSIVHDGQQNEDMNAMFTLEFLNGLTSSSLPPHKLTFKIGCPVILLRNYCRKPVCAMERVSSSHP